MQQKLELSVLHLHGSLLLASQFLVSILQGNPVILVGLIYSSVKLLQSKNLCL